MSRQQELERQIRENQRRANDPYEQDKGVEREAIERAKRELEELLRK